MLFRSMSDSGAIHDASKPRDGVRGKTWRRSGGGGRGSIGGIIALDPAASAAVADDTGDGGLNLFFLAFY